MAGKRNEPSDVSVERARRKLMELQDGQTRMAEIQRESVAEACEDFHVQAAGRSGIIQAHMKDGPLPIVLKNPPLKSR